MEQFTSTEMVLIGALFIFAVVLMVFAGAFVVFGKQLLNAAPPWVKDLVTTNVPRLLDTGERVVVATPNKIDDELYKFVRGYVLQVITEVLTPPAGTVPPAEPPAQTSGGLRVG